MSFKPLRAAAFTALAAGSLLLNARADITTGLVGYWSLSDGPGNSTATDLSGNANTGTLVNYADTTFNNMWSPSTDPTNTWPYALRVTNSLAGFGTNTYVSIPDSPSINTASTNKQWTLAAWVNCSVPGASEPANAGIIAKGISGQEAFALYMSSGKFTSLLRNAAGTGNETVSGTTVPVAGQWYHVAATVLEPKGSADAEVMVYVNGVRESPANANTFTTVYITNLPVTIGSRAAANGTVSLQFLGSIDDARIYNRALTASDIAELYNHKAFTLINSGIGYWNGLAGSGGSATLDTTSLNFCTNQYTKPLGTAAKLSDVLSLEAANSQPLGCTLSDTFFSNGAQVAVASTNLTLAAGGVALGTASAPGTLTFLNSGLNYVVNSSDTFGLKDGANPTALVQLGSGTAILTGTNSFSGGATINSGAVQLGNGGLLTGQELGTAGTVTDNGSLVFNGNNSLSFSKTISGTGSVIQKGSGTLTLSTANNYSGGTTITNATVQAVSIGDSGTSALGTGPVTLSSAMLLYTGSSDTTARQFNNTAGTTNTVDVPNGVNLELSGAVTSGNTFTINKTSPGTLTLSGAADDAHLNLILSGGTVILNKASSSSVHALGGGPSTVGSGTTLQLSGSGGVELAATVALTVSSGGVLDLNSQNNTIASLSLAGTGIGGNGAMLNSAASTTATLTTPVTLAANSTLGGSGNITLPGVIGGSGALTYGGSGILALQGVNTYSGGTIIGSGTLDANVANCIPGNVTVNGTGVLQLDDPNALSSIASITLPGSPSAGTVNLNFTGTQTIGVLVLGSTAMPAGTYGSVGSVAVNQSATFAGTGIIGVTGQAFWDPGSLGGSPGSGGSGNWNTATPNWFTGSGDATWPLDALALFGGTAGTVTLAASVNADELAFSSASYNLTNTDGVSVLTLDGNNPTISIPAGNTTVACTIAESGSSPVTVTGPGTLTLNGTNSYAGGTTINGATLSVNTIADANCSIGPSGTVTIQGGGALSYSGATPGSTTRLVRQSGAAMCYLDVPAGALTLNGQFQSAQANSGPIVTKTGNGTLVLGGAGDNSALTMAINQGQVIINKSSASNVHGLGGGASTIASGASLQLSGSGGSDLFSGCLLTISSGGVMDLNGQTDNMSTLTLSGTGIGGTGALINSTTLATAVLTNGGSGVVLAGPTTVGGQGNIALASKVSGTGPITYAGTGNLTLTNNNNYAGGTLVNVGGTVTLLNSANAAGTGTITVSGTLGVGPVGNNVILPNAISGTGVVNLIETSANNLQLGGSMAGFTGTLNCPTSPGGAAKAQILTTGVGISSAATINIAAAGTFFVANAGVTIPCPINIFGVGNSEVYGALRIENGALISGPMTLYGNTTIGNGQAGASKLATISGPIGQSGGTFGVTFTAEPGTIVLTGTNTYGGATTVSGGVIVVGGAGQLGSGNYAALITNNATFTYNSTAAQTLSGAIFGTGLLAQSGPGTLILSGTNGYTGGTLITNGSTLVIGGSGCLGVTPAATNYAGSITNFGKLVFNTTSAQTLSGVISGTGALTQSGSGTLSLSGANVYTGATVITNGGTLALTGGGSINTTAVIGIGTGATLDVSAYSSYSMLSGIALSASGTGTNAGSNAATIKGATSSGATVTIASPVTLTYTPQTFSGDATHPALYVSQISQGQLIISGSAVTVNNAGASPLGAGTYCLIQVAGGGTISLGTPTVTVVGNGLAPGTAGTLSVNGTSVNLVVAATVVPVPVINSVMVSGGSLIFSGTNGSHGGSYYVLTSTNVALPLSNWTSIATNTFEPTGTFSVTNAVGAIPKQFFVIQIP